MPGRRNALLVSGVRKADAFETAPSFVRIAVSTKKGNSVGTTKFSHMPSPFVQASEYLSGKIASSTMMQSTAAEAAAASLFADFVIHNIFMDKERRI